MDTCSRYSLFDKKEQIGVKKIILLRICKCKSFICFWRRRVERETLSAYKFVCVQSFCIRVCQI